MGGGALTDGRVEYLPHLKEARTPKMMPKRMVRMQWKRDIWT